MPRRPIPEHLNRAINQQRVNEVKLAQEEKRKPRAVNVWLAIHGNVLRDPSKEKQKLSRSYAEKRIQEIEKNREGTPDERPIPEYAPWRPWVDREESL